MTPPGEKPLSSTSPRVVVIGAGAWGTALAGVMADAGQDVTLHTWQAEHARQLDEDRENPFLKGYRIPASVRISADYEQALTDADLAILALPSEALRGVLEQCRPWLDSSTAIVSATKGIENGSLLLMSEVIADVFGTDVSARTAVLSGPSFAREVAQGVPTNVVLASENEDLAERLQHRIATSHFRVYASTDPIGVQVGGALKNVIAIAAGASDALGFGHNTRAALITRGMVEISRLAEAKGGSLLSVTGLAGMGDLVLTCTGDLSRNRTVGYELGKGRPLDEVLGSLGHVAEGVVTAKSAHDLAVELSVELPICNEVYQVLYEGKSPSKTVADLLSRPLGREWL